jgi:hypothetical protein
MAHPTLATPAPPVGAEAQAQTIERLVDECIARLDAEESRLDTAMNDPAARGDMSQAVTRFRIVIRNTDRFLAYVTRLRDLLGGDHRELDRKTWRLRRRVTDGAQSVVAWQRHTAAAEVRSRG